MTEQEPKSVGAKEFKKDRNMSISVRFFDWLLSRLEYGQLKVEWADGTRSTYSGRHDGPDATFALHDHAPIRRMLTRGSVGFAEAFIDGRWDSPDLASLLQNMALNIQAFQSNLRVKAPFNSAHRMIHFKRANTKNGAVKNISHHYDLGNDFYSLWLDDTMTYSCGLFLDPSDDLRKAQINKWDRLIEIGKIKASDHVLEIGCGWGGFAVYAAKKTGCRVTGITISQKQYEWACDLVDREGLQDRVDIKLQDYRCVEGRFDKVVSIEMFEAVGERYWPSFFATIRERLRPGGLAALQVITIEEESFEAYRRRPDFIQIHVFPGGMLPSPPRFEKLAALSGLKTSSTTFFGGHYERTLTEWSGRFESAITAETDAWDLRLRRLWQYYFAYCIAGFRIGKIDVMQTVLVNDGGGLND